jgi:hypothetical protein
MPEWIKTLPRVHKSMSRKESFQEVFGLAALGPDALIEELQKVNPGLMELIEGSTEGFLKGVRGKLSPQEIKELRETILLSHLGVLKQLSKAIQKGDDLTYSPVAQW